MIKSFNEWDTLKRVVLGSATHAHWPESDPVFVREIQNSTWTGEPLKYGPVPERIVEETNLDLEIMAQTLESLGVEVIRPAEMDFVKQQGMYNYCPRDRLIVWGDTVVDCAMMYPCRDQEIHALFEVVDEAATVLTMPRDRGMVLDAGQCHETE